MLRSVEIDPYSGYCFGVEKAIEGVESRLESGEEIYGLGSMVHNEAEIRRLEGKGLKTVAANDLKDLSGQRVFIRAHGEPPETYVLAREHGIDLIDGTCPIVIKLQNRIRKTYDSMDHENEQIVIFGKEDHPETIGLMGQIDNDAVLITDPGETGKIDPKKRIHLFSQTTMDPGKYDELLSGLQKMKVQEAKSIRSNCTICNQMKRRKPRLREFAEKKDIMLFVSGEKSSNGRMLFNYCKEVNSRSYHISEPDQVDRSWFYEGATVGISGATSTPEWQLEKIREHILTITTR